MPIAKAARLCAARRSAACRARARSVLSALAVVLIDGRVLREEPVVVACAQVPVRLVLGCAGLAFTESGRGAMSCRLCELATLIVVTGAADVQPPPLLFSGRCSKCRVGATC